MIQHPLSFRADTQKRMHPESLYHWDRAGQSHPGCMVSLINRQVDRKKNEQNAINKENKMLTRIAKNKK